MSALIWNDSGNRFYEAGVDRGVLYPRHGEPAVWNGLTSVAEAPSDVIISATYLDGIKIQKSTPGEFAATITALTYPDDLLESDGSGDRRAEFDFSYRTLIGNDTEGLDRGYKIHLVCNAMVAPKSPDYSTINAGSETVQFSWALSSRPLHIKEGFRPSSHLVINTALANASAVKAIEDILYGTSTTIPRFPTPLEVFDIFEDSLIVKITDNGDGTWTATGPDYAIYMLDSTTFEINWPSAVYVDEESYTLTSL